MAKEFINRKRIIFFYNKFVFNEFSDYLYNYYTIYKSTKEVSEAFEKEI